MAFNPIRIHPKWLCLWVVLGAPGLYAQCLNNVAGVDINLTGTTVSTNTTYVANNSIVLANGFTSTGNVTCVAFQAGNTITTASAFNVGGNTVFTLRSGNVIRLEPGFHFTAAPGRTLDALIGTSTSGPPPLRVTTTSLAPGTVGAVYSAQTLGATGGVPPYINWAVSTGVLPAGLQLTSGTISGTPTASGNFSLSFQVTDSVGNTASSPGTLVLAIVPAALSILTQALPGGTSGAAYPPQTLLASGGTPPYTWQLPAGSVLPTGLTLTAGQIAGTPSAPGPANFSLRLTDATPQSLTKPFSILVSSGAASGTSARELIRMGSQVVAVEASASVSVLVTYPTDPIFVATGDTQQFYASVAGSSNQSVTWSATFGCGSTHVCANGLYTAPLTAVTDSVKASSVADPTKFAQVPVTVLLTTLSISPSFPEIVSGSSVQFTANIAPNHNTAANWVASPLGYPIPPIGQIGSTTGAYTAPGNITFPVSSFFNLILASSLANPNVSNSAFVQIDPVPSPHWIPPLAPSTATTNSVNFSIQLTGGNVPVWYSYFYVNKGLTAYDNSGCLVQINGNGTYAVGDDSYGFSGSSYCTATASFSPPNAITGAVSISVTLTANTNWPSGTNLNIYGSVTNTSGVPDPAGWQALGTWSIP